MYSRRPGRLQDPERRPDNPRSLNTRVAIPAALGLVCAVALIIVTLARIDRLPPFMAFWTFIPPIEAELADEALAQTAANWVPRELAMVSAFDTWCRRVNTPDCTANDADLTQLARSEDFLREFDATRTAFLAGLPKLRLSGSTLARADLRGANLAGATLSRVNLRGARLANSVFEDARLEDVNLSDADFRNADMRSAEIDGRAEELVRFNLANLDQSTIQIRGDGEVSFNSASLAGAHLRGRFAGDFTAANLSDATLDGTFTGTFSTSDHKPNILKGSFPDITWQNSLLKFHRRQFDDQLLWEVRYFATDDGGTEQRTSYMRLPGSALESADFRRAPINLLFDTGPQENWNIVLKNSFANADLVHLPEGISAPCQWVAFGFAPNTEVFIATWRAWLERGNQPWPPYTGLARHSILKENGEEIVYSEIAADATLLPPVEDCGWVFDD